MAKAKVLDNTPAALGYSMPPEWYPHAGTWFSWPRPEGISFPGKYHTVPENLARIMCEIQGREQVHINVPNENYKRIVKAPPEKRDRLREAWAEYQALPPEQRQSLAPPPPAEKKRR